MNNPTLQVIPLDDIEVDHNQPRKVFDDFAMEELTSSILKKGVLQPILVRPFGNKYKLVSGERRYRASRSVQAAIKTRNTIPAMIVEMDDTEALEAQIVENLQRKDVNPMEEAVAFKQLQEKYSHQEIGLKVGKSEKYVAQRISLNGLIEDLQLFLYAGRMNLTDAYKLARISTDDQKALLKETIVPKDWDKRPDFVFQASHWKLDRLGNDLAKATFKTEDKDLYPEMGACGSCRFNSKNNPSLFEDINKKRICHNSVCFQIKTGRAYQAEIKAVMSDPNILFVNTSYYESPEEKAKLAEVKNLGVTILNREQFEYIEEPDELVSWEDYLEEEKEMYCWDEMDAKQQAKQLKGWQDDYARMKEEHDAEIREYEDDKANGIDAFVVAGPGEGKRVKIVLKKGKKGSASAAAKPGESAEIIAIEQEIAGIKDRGKRNKDLDREKVYKLFSPKLSDDQYRLTKGPLNREEETALLIALCKKSAVETAVKKILGIKSYGSTALYKGIREASDLRAAYYAAYRAFLSHSLVNSYHMDYTKSDDAAAVYGVIKSFYPEDLEKAEADQQTRADKREANAAKRVEALKTKLKELKASQPKADTDTAGKKAEAKKK